MHGTLTDTGNEASKSKDRLVASKTELSDEPLDDWFVVASQSLLAPKPGFILDLETDCGERNGDRYTSGAVKVPTSVVRRLVRGKHGRPWLNAFMDGCDQPWWLDLQADAELGRKVRELR